MQDKFNLFYAWVIGQKPEISDPSNPFQCMDLGYMAGLFLNVPKDTLQHLYAKDVFLKPNADTTKYFDLIPNTPDFVPQAMDLAIFDATPSNIAGHISVCNGVGDLNTFQSLDENWTSNGLVTIITHNYDNPKLLGVLRYKNQELVINDQTKLPIIDENGNQMEVQAVRSRLNDLTKVNLDLKLTLAELNARITQLQSQIDNPPSTASQTLLNAIHGVLYGPGWWWIKWARIKELLPK